MNPISLVDFEKAYDRIKDHIERTPSDYSDALSRMYGCDLYLKLENLQITGSFKVRGAFNKLLQLSETERKNGVIAASAGNHAQGVAYAAQQLGIEATIVMPETTPLAKIQGTEALGARIILHGERYDEAFDKVRELQAMNGFTLVHAFNDEDIIACQGSIALEVIRQVPDMDAFLVPVGGGGMIAGCAQVIKQWRPEVRIIGVEAERMAAMKISIEQGVVTPCASARTIADGIAISLVGDKTFTVVDRHVDEIVTVSEESMAGAIMELLEKEKMLAEGAGVAAFAAIRQSVLTGLEGKKVVAVISGGNIDMTRLAIILERGMEADGRRARFKVIVPDTAGNIERLVSLMVEQGANVIELYQRHYVDEVAIGEVEVELLLETRGRHHVSLIGEAVISAGFIIRDNHFTGG